MPSAKLTQARVKEVLLYSKRSGLFRWRCANRGRIVKGAIAGCIHANGYLVIGVDGKEYYAHRLAWLYVTGSWPTEEIDHKVGKSNKWNNLREATSSLNKENQRSARSDSRSGLIGATTHGNKFVASIKVRGQQIYIGIFHTAQEAHKAYVLAKRRLHVGCTI